MMEWLVGIGTTALAVATAIVALQTYRSRTDAMQPVVSVSVMPPHNSPLLPPRAVGQGLSPAASGRLFTDAEAKSQLLLIQAAGVVVNAGPGAATIRLLRSGHRHDLRWREFEIVEWADQTDSFENLGWLAHETGSRSQTTPKVGSLPKVGGLPLGDGVFLVLPGSISRIRLTLGATVAHWGSPYGTNPTAPPPEVPGVECALQIASASSSSTVASVLTVRLQAAPVKRASDGSGWEIGQPDVLDEPRSTMHCPPQTAATVTVEGLRYRDPYSMVRSWCERR